VHKLSGSTTQEGQSATGDDICCDAAGRVRAKELAKAAGKEKRQAARANLFGQSTSLHDDLREKKRRKGEAAAAATAAAADAAAKLFLKPDPSVKRAATRRVNKELAAAEAAAEKRELQEKRDTEKTTRQARYDARGQRATRKK